MFSTREVIDHLCQGGRAASGNLRASRWDDEARREGDDASFSNAAVQPFPPRKLATEAHRTETLSSTPSEFPRASIQTRPSCRRVCPKSLGIQGTPSKTNNPGSLDPGSQELCPIEGCVWRSSVELALATQPLGTVTDGHWITSFLRSFEHRRITPSRRVFCTGRRRVFFRGPSPTAHRAARRISRIPFEQLVTSCSQHACGVPPNRSDRGVVMLYYYRANPGRLQTFFEKNGGAGCAEGWCFEHRGAVRPGGIREPGQGGAQRGAASCNMVTGRMLGAPVRIDPSE